jgi:endogenous inhibitor of DNA gyrase (YacG/DUF329 family)
MTYATLMDVQCPNCSYEGPAPLIPVEGTDYFLEHWTVVCPVCAKGWVIEP